VINDENEIRCDQKFIQDSVKNRSLSRKLMKLQLN